MHSVQIHGSIFGHKASGGSEQIRYIRVGRSCKNEKMDLVRNAGNWDVVRDYSVWAVDKEYKTKRIQNNDFILFYVKGTGLFRGIFQVVSSWYKSEKLIWSEETEARKKIYRYECKLKPFLIKDVIYKSIREEAGFCKIIRSQSQHCSQGYKQRPVKLYATHIRERILTL